MLESIRASAQSFGVKVAFGVIILVFVFWGIGNFNDRDYSNVVAMVNGEPIVAQEFERAYQSAEEYILRNNPGMTREQLVKDHLGRQVLREMIQDALVQQEARKTGIAATPLELRNMVAQMPIFRDENGKFDPAAYQRYLDNSRMSAAQYEARLGNEIVRQKMFELLTAPVWVSASEALNRYNYLREGRVVDYVFVPASRFATKVKVGQKEIEDWYESHKDEFAIPARADVSYIRVMPEALADPASFSETEVAAWYDANKNDFEHPEQVRARHILIPVGEEAAEEEQKAALEKLAEVKAALESGKTFAEAADEYNMEGAAGPGGELGWILRGQTVPAFEEAVFAAEPGKVGEAVRTPFGWHLILVEEKKQAGTTPLKEAEKDIRQALAKEAGMDKLHEALDNLIEDNILSRPMAESAARYGLAMEKSGLSSQADLMKTLGIDESGAKALLDLPAGSPLDTALEAGDNYIIARIEEFEPAAVKPLQDVKSQIEDILKDEKALSLAMQDAQKLLEKISGQPAEDLKAEGIELQTSPVMERGGQIPGFLPDPGLNAAIFDTAPGQWLARPFQVVNADGAGAFVGRVQKIVLPEAEEYKNVASLMERAARQERMEALFNLFVQQLADRAEIQLANQALVDRTSM